MIESFSSLSTIALALVFLVAAITKLVAPEKTRSEFANLGLPQSQRLSRLVPALEFVVVCLLILMPRIGGIAAVVMICGFTGVLLRALRSGRSVSCGCLGALSNKPISYWTIARNGGLLLLAAMTSTIETVVVPELVAMLISGSTALLVAIGFQLFKLRTSVGALWQITLAGEQDREPELVLDLEIDLDEQVERLVPTNSYPVNREG